MSTWKLGELLNITEEILLSLSVVMETRKERYDAKIIEMETNKTASMGTG